MAWFYLGLAAIFEVTFAMSMKYADGFTNARATVVTIVAVIARDRVSNSCPARSAGQRGLSNLDRCRHTWNRRLGIRVSGRGADAT